MKTTRFISGMLSMALVIMFMSCEEEGATPEPATEFNLSGLVTYPAFDGTATPADGAVVYISQDGSSTPIASTIASSNGGYQFNKIENGTYTVWAYYDTENTNNAGGRMKGAIFMGEGAEVIVENTNASQDFALASVGQAEAVTVNTYEGGNYNQDWNHSVVSFEFPYDQQNAPYTGQFKSKEIFIDFDPGNLGGSKIEATIDLLTVYTDSPGGRDPLWDTDGTLWQDPSTLEYKLGCISRTFGISTPDDATRYGTFASTSIEPYGNGYLATGPMTFNGVESDVEVFFQFIPGFDGENRSGDPTRYSSFQATFDFAAKAVFGIESGHVLDAPVTVNASFQVTKPL